MEGTRIELPQAPIGGGAWCLPLFCQQYGPEHCAEILENFVDCPEMS